MDNVLVLGNGAREHCIVEKLLESNNVNNVYITPKSAIDLKNVINLDYPNISNEQLLYTCKHYNIKMVVIGPEKYLINGTVDFLESHNYNVFGPNKKCSKIEGSKVYSKEILNLLKIPTPEYYIFDNYNNAITFLDKNFKNNYVIKADGLAQGKGVYIPNSLEEAKENVKSIMFDKIYGNSGNQIVIEEKIIGEEVSIMGFCNGSDISLMPQCKDYKKIYDDDKGLNTGGMGAHAPVHILDDIQLEELRICMNLIVKQLNYKGVLYAGIIKNDSNYYVLEFNCRFGDPECQVLLNLLDSDFYQICLDTVYSNSYNIKWKENTYASNIILSHNDYPLNKSKKILPIKINNIDNDIKLYYGNVLRKSNKLYTTGGRVISVVNCNSNIFLSFNAIINNIHKITYDSCYYRKDIGLNYSLSLKNKNIPIKIGILGSSKGTSIQKCIDYIENKKLNASIEIIISNKPSYILTRAQEHNINSIYLSSKNKSKTDYDKQIVDILKLYKVDVVLLVGYNKIISSLLINTYNNCIYNIHPSLLPKYSGLWDKNVHKDVIDNNEIFTGCTLHRVTNEVDKGDIILQKQCLVNTNNIDELKSKVQELESDCIVNLIQLYNNGQIYEKIDYESSGVSIKNGNNFVKCITDIINTKDFGQFCSIYKYNDIYLTASTDGVGTKLDLAQKITDYSTIGIDLVAMSVNDILARGSKPLFFLDYIAVEKLNTDMCSKIVESIKKGCDMAGCQLIGGETAEMGNIYNRNKFDLAGFCVGIVEKENILPKKIMKGDIIYGLESNGIHSNGFSLVRKLLDKNYDYDFNELMKPTRIYNEILEIQKECNLVGCAHITGGGFDDNIKRILKNNKYTLDYNWNIPKVFYWIKEKSNLSWNEMYQIFNCGIGMVLIIRGDVDTEKYNLKKIGIIYQ